MEPLDQTVTSVGESDSEVESRERTQRMRLDALLARVQRRRLPRVPIPCPFRVPTNFTGEVTNAADDQGEEGRQNQEIDEGIVESGKSKSAHLIAKALGVEEPDATGKAAAAEESTGKFFDCSICLEMAKDPVLTCCGHLFCWPCFYQVSYAYLKARECPVCKGEVTESGIIPIYGNGSAGDDRELELKEAGLIVPPRPRAPRVESIRQQLISHDASSIFPNVWRFSIGQNVGLGEQVRFGTPNTITDRNYVELIQSLPPPDNNQHIGSHPVQGDSSSSSLSSALYSTVNNVERLFEDLESYIRSHRTGGSNPRPESRTPDVVVTNSAAVGSVSPLSRNVDNIATIGSEIPQMFYPSSNGRRRNDVSRPQPESLTPDVAVTNSAAAAYVSPLHSNIAAVISEIQTTNNIPQISMFYPSSNGRRRNDVSRPQPESVTPDVAVTNSAAAASVSPLRRNIAAVISEMQTTDNIPRIRRRRNDVSGQVPDEPRRRRRLC